jgi:hypothetical protein
MTQEPTGHDHGIELVSPELALVDPVLRRRLLAALEEPPSPSEDARPERETGPGEAVPADPRERDLTAAVSPATPPQRRVRLGVVAAASAAAFVLGAKFARPSYINPQPQTGSAASAGRSSPTNTGGPRSEALMLAWTAANGATGYEVAIFAGHRRVFAADTGAPSLSLSAPLAQTLLPLGPLTWEVWPIRARALARTPIVQSRLTLP